ncbi:MAG: SCO family protein [Gemmatimonadota bacterium]
MTSARVNVEERAALAGLVALFTVTAAWWALALWPVAEAPTWLARTRYVCFGVNDSGLPDAGGWIGLVAGPAGMLAILLVACRGAIRNLLRASRDSIPLRATFTALVAGALSLVVGATWRVRQANATPVENVSTLDLAPETYPRLDRPAPALELTAHDGSARGLSSLRGRVVFITFAFAHCETVCPLVVHDVLSARRRLQEEDGAAPAILIVTLDPWRDTPSRLSSIARAWQFPANDVWLLGGSVLDVEAALTAWQVPRSRNDRNGEVTHSSLVYIVDHAGRIAFASSGNARTLAALARRL